MIYQYKVNLQSSGLDANNLPLPVLFELCKPLKGYIGEGKKAKRGKMPLSTKFANITHHIFQSSGKKDEYLVAFKTDGKEYNLQVND